MKRYKLTVRTGDTIQSGTYDHYEDALGLASAMLGPDAELEEEDFFPGKLATLQLRAGIAGEFLIAFATIEVAE